MRICNLYVENPEGVRRIRAGFLLALPAMALGLIWLYMAVEVIVSNPGEARGAWRVVFVLLNLFFTAPFAIAGLYGIRLLRRSTKSDIKGAAICLLLIGVMTGHYLVEEWLRGTFAVPESQSFEWTELLLISASVAVYVGVCPAIMRRDRILFVHWRDFYGKLPAFLIAYAVFGVAVTIVDVADDYIRHSPYAPLLLFSPLIAAWAFYALSLRIICGKAPPRRKPGTFRLHLPPASHRE